MAGRPMEAPFFLATAVHLLREIGERLGDPAGGVVGEDALARGGGLGRGDGARHHGVEDAERGAVLLPDGALDVAREVVAGVVERHQDALDGQPGVDLAPHAPDGLEQPRHVRGGEVLRRHGDDHAVSRDEGVDGDDSERGGAVEQDVVVVGAQGLRPRLQDALAGHGHEHGHLEAGELDVGGHEVDPLAMAQDARARVLVGPLDDRFDVGRDRRLDGVGVGPSERFGQIPLRVGVDQQHAPAAPCERHPEAQRGGRLAGAALLVGDRYCLAWHVASSLPRTCAASREVRRYWLAVWGSCRRAAGGRHAPCGLSASAAYRVRGQAFPA